MSCPRVSFVPVMGHEMHVTEWGDPSNAPLVMWHGLARTGRDFDELAAALSDTYFVLCPDTIGRGLSSWSKDPQTEYCVAYYAGLAEGMLDFYNIENTAWLGTSMGGLIGMRIASSPHANRITSLIINDIGPEIPQDAIDRILKYAGTSPEFETLHEAEEWLRAAYLPFGPASEAFWRRMARSSVRRLENGMLTTHYDPKITIQFTASPDELVTWDRFADITCPTHVIQGQTSDILPPPILNKMKEVLPTMGVTTISDCGHAPTLSRHEDISLVRSILSRQSRDP